MGLDSIQRPFDAESEDGDLGRGQIPLFAGLRNVFVWLVPLDSEIRTVDMSKTCVLEASGWRRREVALRMCGGCRFGTRVFNVHAQHVWCRGRERKLLAGGKRARGLSAVQWRCLAMVVCT
jgi:hypothetical protein